MIYSRRCGVCKITGQVAPAIAVSSFVQSGKASSQPCLGVALLQRELCICGESGFAKGESWAVEKITGQRKSLSKKKGKTRGYEYLIIWRGVNPATGKPWPPDWTHESDLAEDLIPHGDEEGEEGDGHDKKMPKAKKARLAPRTEKRNDASTQADKPTIPDAPLSDKQRTNSLPETPPSPGTSSRTRKPSAKASAPTVHSKANIEAAATAHAEFSPTRPKPRTPPSTRFLTRTQPTTKHTTTTEAASQPATHSTSGHIGNNIWTVDEILDERVTGDGRRVEYHVKWAGIMPGTGKPWPND